MKYEETKTEGMFPETKFKIPTHPTIPIVIRVQRKPLVISYTMQEIDSPEAAEVLGRAMIRAAEVLRQLQNGEIEDQDDESFMLAGELSIRHAGPAGDHILLDNDRELGALIQAKAKELGEVDADEMGHRRTYYGRYEIRFETPAR